ncbi:MAG TPA: methyltransferase domain-containing protein [Pyrinomonadaceae bacterium]
MEINNPQITIESLMDKLREGARRQQSAGGAADNAAASVSNPSAAFGVEQPPLATAAGFPSMATALDGFQLALQPDFEPRADDQYHAHDLLKYHDRNFIQNAYRAILKRGPDATGYTAFLESLRSGRLNKIDVLARLRYSTEGRAKHVQVKGLFMPAAVRQLYRVPLLGYLLRLCVSLVRLPLSARHQQQFEAHMLAQQQLIVDHANHLSQTLSQHGHEVAGALAQLADAARDATAQQQERFDQLRQAQQALEQSLPARFDLVQDQLLARLYAAQDEMAQRVELVKQQFDVLIDKAVARWQREAQRLETRQHEQSLEALTRAEELTNSARAEAARLAAQLRDEIKRVFQKEQEVRAELTLQGQRVARLLEETSVAAPASFDDGRQEAFADERAHLHDALYLSLEESFRGSAAEIKERLQVYRPLIEQARIVSESQPLLDIGCGRGEWLELLREWNVPASGVDANRALIESGQARGLAVVEADVMTYLRQLPDASLGALTGFHIVEHLPLETLLRLLDEAVRVLKPGGLVIFETPNPENVLVGSCNFYFDPTHRNPLPAPVMKFFLESRGLLRVQIIRLNPSDAEPVAGDSEIVKRFNQYFYGPMDYAVVGWKI